MSVPPPALSCKEIVFQGLATTPESVLFRSVAKCVSHSTTVFNGLTQSWCRENRAASRSSIDSHKPKIVVKEVAEDSLQATIVKSGAIKLSPRQPPLTPPPPPTLQQFTYRTHTHTPTLTKFFCPDLPKELAGCMAISVQLLFALEF